MTQTIALHGTAPEINPLYIKLRRRFACDGDRTVGEMKAQEAIRDGYRPYATGARSASAGSTVAECHVTRANSLPAAYNHAHVRHARKTSLSGGAVAIMILCTLLLIGLLFSGARINELNRELSGLQSQNGALHAEEAELSLLLPEEHAAAQGDTSLPADENLCTENLLRAFSA